MCYLQSSPKTATRSAMPTESTGSLYNHLTQQIDQWFRHTLRHIQWWRSILCTVCTKTHFLAVKTRVARYRLRHINSLSNCSFIRSRRSMSRACLVYVRCTYDVLFDPCCRNVKRTMEMLFQGNGLLFKAITWYVAPANKSCGC